MSPRAVTLVPYTPAAHLLYHHCCCCCNCCTDAATYVCPVCTGSCAAAVTSRPNISILEPSPSLPGFRNFSFRSVKLKTVKTFLDVHLKKKRQNDEDTGKKPSPGRHSRDSRNLWNPPIGFKKTGRETLPLAIPQVELLFRILRKTKFRQILMVLVHNGRFWADFGQI